MIEALIGDALKMMRTKVKTCFANFQLEVEHSLSDVDRVVMYFHETWNSNPTHMGTVDARDLIEFIVQSEVPLVFLYPRLVSPDSPMLSAIEHKVPIINPLHKELEEEILAAIKGRNGG